MKKYKYLRLLPMIIVLIGILVFLIYNNKLNNRFIVEEVNAKIVKRNNWQLRTTEFYLDNGLRIDSTYVTPLNIKIGDSISKKANTGKFDIFKKSEGKYVFYKTYNINN